MAFNIRETAKQLAASSAKSGADNMNPGKGTLIVKALKCGGKPEFYAGDTFVAEFYVEECQGYTGKLDKEKAEKPAGNTPGSSTKFVQQFDEHKDTAWPNTKAFVLKLLENTPPALEASFEAWIPKDAERAALAKPRGTAAWGEADEFALIFEFLCEREINPARGLRIKYDTYEYTARRTGTVLTLPNWTAVDNTEAAVASALALLDGK